MPFSRTEPNVPAYEEIDESPIEVTSVTSETVQIGPDFNQLRVIVDAQNTTDPVEKGIRVNGHTSTNYDFRETDATTTTSADKWRVGNGFRAVSEIILIPGQFRTRVNTVDSTNKVTLEAGVNFAVGAPLNQITLFDPGQTRSFDFRARVYGLTI